MAVTQDSLRTRIRALLYGGRPQEVPYQDALQGNLTAAGTSVDVLDGTQWTAGDLVDFDDGDQALVTAVATNTLTLRRFGGATTHSTDDVIYKNPRYTTRAIDDAVDHVLQDLWPQVWLIATQELTYSSGTYWYEIADDQLKEILTAYYADTSYGFPRALIGWKQFSGVDATQFANAQGIYLPFSLGLNDATTFWVVYRAELNDVTNLLDRQEGLVAYGAVAMLMPAANIHRTTDPGRWTDRTVQPGQDARDGLYFTREFEQLRRRERIRLLEDEDRLPKNIHAEARRRFRP